MHYLCVVKIDADRMTVIEDPGVDEDEVQVWDVMSSEC